MNATCRRFRSGLLVVVLLVAGTAAAPAPARVGAQRAGEPEHIVVADEMSFYESPTFGYVVGWNASEAPWQVDTDQSADGIDQLFLASEAGQVSFEGYEGDDGEPATCLERAARQYRRLSGVSRFRQAVFRHPDGGDWSDLDSYRAASDTRAIDVYTLRFTDDEGESADLVLQLDCRMLVPDSAVLLVVYVTTLEGYNDETLFYWADDLMGGVALPRASFGRTASGRLSTHDSYKDAADNQDWPQAPRLLLDSDGDEIGLASFVGNSPGADFLQVLIENTGDRRLDVRRLPLVAAPTGSEPGSPIVAADSVTVFGLASARGTGMVLRPGDRAIVRLEFDPPLDYAGCGMWDLLYATDDGQTSTIGTLGGCGGGGLRPRISTGS